MGDPQRPPSTRGTHGYTERRRPYLITKKILGTVLRSEVTAGSAAHRNGVFCAAGSVGVVVPEPSALFSDSVFPLLLRGIVEALSASVLQMVLFAPASRADVSPLEHYLARGHIDDLIM